MTLKELENHYEEFLQADLKVLPEKATTLFDIAGFPHYETVLSNFYSFYLNPSGQHGLGDLFISALSDIIERKAKGLSVIENSKICYTEREVRTSNGKYIDIVINEPSEISNEVENAIIIENKVNAAVYNDLIEYYDSIKVNKNKVGVVLSLRPEKNLPKQFISITHDEFTNQIEQSSGSYFLNADLKQTVILKDFIQNIKAMSQTIDLKEQYEFFLKHHDKIKEINSLYLTIKNDVFKQVDDVCEKLNLGLKLQGRFSSQLRYFFSNSAPVYFTVWLDDLFNGDGEICIFVELNEEGLGVIDNINKISFTDEEKKLLDETTKVRKTYIHYATRKVKPSQEDIKDFTNYVYNQIIQTPLKDIFIKIERLLNDKK
ncbi:MAG: hypothetical protein A2W93_09530 [Bacteroidetes bacterium GWF2_43_63]|nr:MAG: hypothetical protein A2W94_05915 [Bacteroidetes bacterium GWE2_42_42]OFY54534.1 MAG: hypothetical protein A2W93_09530 [Bacteroidetes bacterium GWF2_43_63]HBG70487.1 hypothetical protein [Bacteroidales bacterium]HCB63395.1 hypothetical protein [Bacteroidales bacterium]